MSVCMTVDKITQSFEQSDNCDRPGLPYVLSEPDVAERGTELSVTLRNPNKAAFAIEFKRREYCVHSPKAVLALNERLD